MQITMDKWETFQQQQAAEEVTSEKHPDKAEGQQNAEAQEAALNPRIQALRRARDEAERKLQEALLNLESREDEFAFQKAKELINAGWHMVDLEGIEGTRYLYLLPAGVRWSNKEEESEQYEYTYERGADTPFVMAETRNIFRDLGLQESPYAAEVIKYLIDLTQEDLSFNVE